MTLKPKKSREEVNALFEKAKALVDSGVSREKACRTVGMSVTSYRGRTGERAEYKKKALVIPSSNISIPISPIRRGNGMVRISGSAGELAEFLVRIGEVMRGEM